MSDILSLSDAISIFEHSLVLRDIEITKKENYVKPGNARLFSTKNEIFHVKFTRTPFRPDAEKAGPARELHLKLQFAMSQFEYQSSHLLLPDEKGTMVGIDEDLILALLDYSLKGYFPYIVTALARGVFLWLPAIEFYEFVMRYDTFIKFPRSGTPVCYVPTGHFQLWQEPKVSYPATI
jgi:hypothetical protein